MSGRTLARVFIGGLWAFLIVLIIAVGLELFLSMRWSDRREVKDTGRPRHDRLMKAYHPFAVQYINPTYLFFFPFDPADRMALSNQYVTLDSAGFRGPGPEFAGDRELAFLVGGSTAFSYSSADSTSITGFLNRLQDRYFFVNAGVPSWNSTQELFRLAHQILNYDPALIVTFDGANDMAILVQQHEKGLVYPPGTPESFHALQELVGDIRSGSTRPRERGLITRFFPRLTTSITTRLIDSPPPGPIPRDRIEETAAKYVDNTALMSTLAESNGGRFVSIFQPIIWLHANGPEHELDYQYRTAYRQYHRFVFSDTAGFERRDFSNMFDHHFDDIPYLNPDRESDLTDDAIFVDPVHVFDRGNRMIARQIIDDVLFVSEPGQDE